MKPYKSLRILIAGGAMAGFLTGWGLLAHAGKPAPMQPVSAIVAPNPQLDRGGSVSGNNGLADPGPLAPLPSQSFRTRPRFRTGGS